MTFYCKCGHPFESLFKVSDICPDCGETLLYTDDLLSAKEWQAIVDRDEREKLADAAPALLEALEHTAHLALNFAPPADPWFLLEKISKIARAAIAAASADGDEGNSDDQY